MMIKNKNKIKTDEGFTVVELMIIIAITVIFFSKVPSLYASYYNSNGLGDSSSGVVNTLKRARLYTVTGREDQQWGVHFETAKFVLFKGTSYSVSDPENEDHDLLSAISVININLNGGGSDLIFEPITGETNQHGSVGLSHITSGELRTININAAGLIND